MFGAKFNLKRSSPAPMRCLSFLTPSSAQRDWLVGEQVTIADIALYSYTAHAPEGNVALDAYPHIRAWLARIEALPGFVAMPATAAGLRA
ncbi:MAG: glutathione binding-like protein [Rivihabitans pingtungensis]